MNPSAINHFDQNWFPRSFYSNYLGNSKPKQDSEHTFPKVSKISFVWETHIVIRSLSETGEV